MYEEKVIGDKCPNCEEGEYVLSPKTGKVFCEKKCWTLGQAKKPTYDQSQPQSNTSIPPSELDAIREGFKKRDLRIEALEKRIKALEETVGNETEDIPIIQPKLNDQDASMARALGIN